MPRLTAPNSNEPCPHVTIAHSEIGHVSICPDCSVLHLSLSHVSLRLSPDAFRTLAGMVGAAQARLEQASCGAAVLHDEAVHGPSRH